MKKLDWYIVKRFLGTFFFILLIILAVSIVIDIAEKIDDFIEKKPPIDLLIFSYYVNFMLFYGNLLTPICVFLAVIFFTSRMTANTEIVAMLSGGISFYRVMLPYMATALFIAGVSFYLNAYRVPDATRDRINFEYEYLKNKRVWKETNIHKKVATNPDSSETFMYLYSFNQLEGEGYIFTLENVKDMDLRQKLTAGKIKWIDSLETWRAEDVRIHQFLPNGKEQLVFKDHIDTAFTLTPDDIFIKEMKAESMPLNELYTSIDRERELGSGLEEELILEKYERFAYPFAAIILTIIGFSVSTKKRRGGTALQIGIGLIISFIYVLLVVTGQQLIGDKMPAWLAVWMPNITFFIISLFMLRVAPK